MPVNFASMLQAARGQRSQPPDIQQTLANMRQRLYGMPAQGGQAVGQPNLGGDMIQQPNLGAGNIGDLMQRNPPQAPGKPAWQQLAEAGIAGQGSPAANQARLAQLQAGNVGDVVGGGARVGFNPNQPQPLDPNDPANFTGPLSAATGGGLQAPAVGVTGTAVAPTPEGFWTPERMDQANQNTAAWDPGFTASPLPATMTPQPPPNLKPALQGVTAPGIARPRQPAHQRIAAARQGIRQGVQQALRKPARAPVSAGPRGATK